MLLNLLASMTEKQLTEVVQPLLDVVSVVVPVLIAVVGSVGAIWVIILAVKYARADDPQEHEKAKGGLKNAIIGFVLLFVLLVALRVGVALFKNWWVNYEVPSFAIFLK